ncbi:hypothetical protein ACHAXT_008262 [Thalassiosira profunda]
MDLLKGYGSDDSSASSSSAEDNAPNASTTAPASSAPTAKPQPNLPRKGKVGGKRILSLGAVLPPEIFDRLTRPPEDDDSSASSFEGDGGGQSKKRKRRDGEEQDAKMPASKGDGTGDRAELNSLLSELRSTPLHVAAKKAPASKKSSDIPKEESGKLGMAFMSYTSTTKTSKKNVKVVDVHAPSDQPKQSLAKTTQSSADGGEKIASKPALPVARPLPSFTRMSAAAPVAASFARKAPEYPAASMPEYPVQNAEPSPVTTSMADEATYNNSNAGPKSRKQRREEERALRSGAFDSAAATDLQGPSPTEFAPTAHAAAVASRAARARGVAAGGGGSVKNIAMYDPSSGGDVKGLGVTGKHRSKHQINQLMASAISLEAERAGQAELARFGMGGGTGKGSSRADAKRKYGW